MKDWTLAQVKEFAEKMEDEMQVNFDGYEYEVMVGYEYGESWVWCFDALEDEEKATDFLHEVCED